MNGVRMEGNGEWLHCECEQMTGALGDNCHILARDLNLEATMDSIK